MPKQMVARKVPIVAVRGSVVFLIQILFSLSGVPKVFLLLVLLSRKSSVIAVFPRKTPEQQSLKKRIFMMLEQS